MGNKRWLIVGLTALATAVDTAAATGLLPAALRGVAALLAQLAGLPPGPVN